MLRGRSGVSSSKPAMTLAWREACTEVDEYAKLVSDLAPPQNVDDCIENAEVAPMAGSRRCARRRRNAVLR